jgi:hypothetical protein
MVVKLVWGGGVAMVSTASEPTPGSIARPSQMVIMLYRQVASRSCFADHRAQLLALRPLDLHKLAL